MDSQPLPADDARSLSTDHTTHRYPGGLTGAAVLLGLWVIVALHCEMERINQLAQSDPSAATDEIFWLTRIVAFGLGLGAVIIGARVWWLGHRLRKDFWFPSLDLDIGGSSQADNGLDPSAIGRAAEMIGVMLVFLGIAVAWLLTQLAQMMHA
ncbi:MAG: hypothetical protein JW888_06545 [Pirellulales bacterium]|nr:hypothetical protein [Pirellulales bacterium]